MTDSNTKNEQAKTSKELPPSSANINANDYTKQSKAHADKPRQTDKRNKQWSLIRHWRQASHARKVKWVGAFIVGLVGLAYSSSQIWQVIQAEIHYTTEHRPKVILNKPPMLVGSVVCYTTDRAIHEHIGEMQIWVKNIGQGDAAGAFVAPPMMKLIPEQKTGFKEVDDIPSLNAELCKIRPSAKAQMFGVERGQEMGVNIRQAAAVYSLVKTDTVTITLGGQQTEPVPDPNSKPSDQIKLPSNARFQLYMPVCAYYQGFDGKNYGTCKNYRLRLSKHIDPADEYGFSCSETPVTGQFEQVLMSYCDN